jgi:hypothetical protein
MNFFPRPAGALTAETFTDLPIGTAVWSICGVARFCQMPGSMKAKRTELIPFAEHRDYSPIHECDAALLVFDMADQKGKLIKRYAGDCNLTPSQSNNNYLFASPEAAQDFVEFIRANAAYFPTPLYTL